MGFPLSDIALALLARSIREGARAHDPFPRRSASRLGFSGSRSGNQSGSGVGRPVVVLFPLSAWVVDGDGSVLLLGVGRRR